MNERAGVAALFLFISGGALALDRAALQKLAAGDNDQKLEAIGVLVAEGDPAAAGMLARFAEGEIEIDGKRVEVVVNNRVRAAVDDALAAFKLLSPDTATRQPAPKPLADGPNPASFPLVNKPLQADQDPDIRPLPHAPAPALE